MNTGSTRISDGFQLGRNTDPRLIRPAAVNFNKFLVGTDSET
jgi:hypothetical protein